MKYEYLMIVAMTTKITLHYYTTIHSIKFTGKLINKNILSNNLNYGE